MQVKPFTLPGTRILAHYAECIAAALPGWSEQWQCVLRCERVVDVSRGDERQPPRPALRFESDTGAAWMVFDAAESLLGEIGAAALNRSIPLAEPSRSSRLLGELGVQVLRELADTLGPDNAGYRLQRRDTLGACLTEYRDRRRIRIDFDLGGHALSLWQPWSSAEPQVAAFIESQIAAAAATPLATRLDSLGPEEIRTEAQLGSAGISLQSLGSMRVGDVLCLDTALNEPLTLNVLHRDGYFSGILGKQDEHFAIRIEDFVSA